MNIHLVPRKINYFELAPKLNDGATTSDFSGIFRKIIALSKSCSAERFITHKDRLLYFTDIKIDDSTGRIIGKILNIRMDGFPELMNTTNDAIREIDANDEEGIIESTHFILSIKGEPLLLSLEHNQYGPRIADFIYYFEHFLNKEKPVGTIDYIPLVRDDLKSYQHRINRISLVTAKVHKNNIARIKEYDKDLFDAFESAEKVSEAEYVTLELKYDYRSVPDTLTIKDKIFKIINRLAGNKKDYNVFDKLIVKAEDSEYSNSVKQFDLLNNWVKSEIRVEKKDKSRVIVTADILEKMGKELSKEFPKR